MILQGLDALALQWKSLTTEASWKASLATVYGRTVWLMALAAIAASVSNQTFGKPLRRMGESITLLLLGAVLAASGHAAMAGAAGGVRACNGDCALDRFADSVTAVAGYACRSGGGATVPALLRFSRLISWILALLLSGTVLTYLQLEDVDSL